MKFSQSGTYFSAERTQYILWLPVLFGLGITLYFSLLTEPPAWQALSVSTLLGSLLLVLRHSAYARMILVCGIFLSGGFAVAALRAHSVEAPVIPDRWKNYYNVTATVETVSDHTRGKRIWLENISLKYMKAEDTPKRIRITATTRLNDAKAGDRVSLSAVLYPPAKPPMPEAYDFARQAYFEQIGAVGYAVSAFTILERSKEWRFTPWLSDMRHRIAKRLRVNNTKENESGDIAAALLVGERGGISNALMDAMRNAGLAHLLAISGMHLALVAAICFFSLRGLLALSEKLTLYHPIKQYAAFFAILCSALYLLITGAPISAQRAFIMTSLILLAVLLNRNVTPLRSVALAAFIVLIITPESILSPSFQMSFAAAISLIAAFEALRKPMAKQLEEANALRRVQIYIYGIIISSCVAGLATAPFALYHFSHASTYSLLANLVAIPLTSFWIMPWGVLALALLPLGLEQIALIPMGWGINTVTSTATWISALPNAHPAVDALPLSSLTLITIAGLWLTLWKTKLRLYGLPLLIPAIILAFLTKEPQIIINDDGKMLALRGTDGVYYFPAKTSPGFVRDSWMERLGQSDYKKLKIGEATDNLICHEDRSCLYTIADKTMLLAHTPDYARKHCDKADYLIDMDWKNPITCPKLNPLFNRQDLKYKGTHTVYFDDNGTIDEIRNVVETRGKRLW